MTAFFLYAADHRAKVREELGEGCTVGDISKKIGKQWAEIDDDEKQKYQDQAAKNKAQYEKDLEAYHAGMFFIVHGPPNVYRPRPSLKYRTPK